MTNVSIGKYYTRKGVVKDKTRMVTDIRDGYVHFDDGSLAKTETVMAEFNDVIDADDFFAPKVDPNLIRVAEAAMEGAPVSYVKADVVENQQQQPYQPPVQQYQQPQQPVKLPGFQNTPDPVENYDIAVTADVNAPQLHPHTPQRQDSPETALFKKMKRSFKVKLSIPLDELVPEPKNVQAMNDMFEMSVVDYLADDIFNRLLGDSFEFKSKIKEQLEFALLGKKTPKKTKMVEPVIEPTVQIKRKRTIPNVPKEERESMNEGLPRKTKKQTTVA